MSQRLVTALEAYGFCKPLDLDAVVQNQAFDVIGEFGFSKDYGATADLWNGSGARACLALKNAMICAVERTRMPHARIPYTPLWHEHQQSKQALLGIFRNLLKEVQARGAPAEEENSIAAHLVRTRDDQGRPIPDVRIWSEMSIFFFAGTPSNSAASELSRAMLFPLRHQHAMRLQQCSMSQ
ncbi:g9017 [Coccomyxa elongata]